MKNFNLHLMAAAAAVMSTLSALPAAQAAIVISAGGQGYSQNFDTLNITTVTNQVWANDSTLVGWSLFRQPAPGTALTSYGADNGGSNAGSFYTYGPASRSLSMTLRHLAS